MRANFRTYNLAVSFYRETETLELSRHLKDQLHRAASSIALNLAEGAGRRTPRDQRRFYSIALGSLRECGAILELGAPSDTSLVKAADVLGAHIFRLIQACGG